MARGGRTTGAVDAHWGWSAVIFTCPPCAAARRASELLFAVIVDFRVCGFPLTALLFGRDAVQVDVGPGGDALLDDDGCGDQRVVKFHRFFGGEWGAGRYPVQ